MWLLFLTIKLIPKSMEADLVTDIEAIEEQFKRLPEGLRAGQEWSSIVRALEVPLDPSQKSRWRLSAEELGSEAPTLLEAMMAMRARLLEPKLFKVYRPGVAFTSHPCLAIADGTQVAPRVFPGGVGLDSFRGALVRHAKAADKQGCSVMTPEEYVEFREGYGTDFDRGKTLWGSEDSHGQYYTTVSLDGRLEHKRKNSSPSIFFGVDTTGFRSRFVFMVPISEAGRKTS